MQTRAFRLHDTLSRTVKEVQLGEPGHLRFYSCGPTVYSFAHIGNFRTFLTGDLVVRTARALGLKVSYVTNITDVGHLTDDDVADATGEDKMAKGLRSKEGEAFQNVWELADHYAEAFKQDWSRLNLARPLIWPKATQHMREQIHAIERLIERGHAYETPSGVYFSVSSFDGYGKLSGNRDQEQLYRTVRNVVTDESKRHPADFALWKKDDKHLMQWYSPWGWGFPGWHIECSVMSMQYLGETLDLHAGGEDLIFPHHECEIAQSECLTGKPFATHWMHTRFLLVDGERMSKSAGNFFTVRQLVEEQGADPLGLRYALISGVYGKPLNFTLQTLRDATQNVERYRSCDEAADKALANQVPGDDRVGATLEDLYDLALEAMANDLNTSVALAKALEGTRVILREGDALSAESAIAAKRFLDRINGLLGIVRHEDEQAFDAPASQAVDEDWIKAKIEERAQAKKDRQFAAADAIRAEIEAVGVELRDTPDGTVWKVRAGKG